MRLMRATLIAVGLLLAGCVTTPAAIRYIPPGDPQLAEVQHNVAAHTGAAVRWGGIILSVENRDNETWIEVLELKLTSAGMPKTGSRSDGRFLINIAGFLDPVIYAKGGQITVTGILEGSVERLIGDQPYSFPVVKAAAHYLWNPPRYYGYRPYPYDYYPPYPYVYYPFYPYVYYPPYSFSFGFGVIRHRHSHSYYRAHRHRLR